MHGHGGNVLESPSEIITKLRDARRAPVGGNTVQVVPVTGSYTHKTQYYICITQYYMLHLKARNTFMHAVEACIYINADNYFTQRINLCIYIICHWDIVGVGG